MNPVNIQQRKYTVIALLVLSVFIVIIATRGVSKSISLLSGRQPSNEPLVVDPEDAAITALRGKDTDGDGLNDYEELTLYNSSPYLIDSDSDGINDKEEVDAGKDPNCPGGQNCYGVVVDQKVPFSETPPPSEQQQLDPATADALKELLPANPTANEIRLFLISQGASESAVKEISDEALLENYSRSYNAL